jgi:hypothetical protein
MNERIDELMIEAGARFEFLHGVHYDDFQYKKFAELLIQECIRSCEGNSEYKNHIDTEYGMGFAAGIKLCKEVIRTHFGVEE